MERIKKPWGYELVFAKTNCYVGKILHINKGGRLSLQFHKIKDETIYLSSGQMELEIEEKGKMTKRVLNPGDFQKINPGTKHRFFALEECRIFEVSTPEIEDVVRLEDQYGRV